MTGRSYGPDFDDGGSAAEESEDVAICREHAPRAAQILANLVNERDVLTGLQVRAAIEILAHLRYSTGRAPHEEPMDYEEIIRSLGPRDPNTPTTL